ncbi:hypothetical protein [Entomomonas asaccharolytica]|uniref:Uncharacterized protein n=1 Tax=Entomomonas asaccharolytica TaxID=2785331 RepID=A0A974NFW4_9GAMM|nr:hypothetical protein [Entomomonas asaccharolytica]QQP86025.1 hypothetical protein JHT90_01865 [Entomomonas asaccharolytica]
MSNYYAPTAYNSQAIPDQPVATQWLGLEKSTATRLPWGNTQPVASQNMFDILPPSLLRRNVADWQEEKQLRAKGEAITSRLDLGGNLTEEVFSYAPLAIRTRFWLYAHVAGETLTKWFPAILIPTYLILLPAARSWTALELFFFLALYWLPFPIIWLISYAVKNWLPSSWWLATGRKGIVWEFNRRTGMVTIVNHRKGDFSAPFYEWDAYLGMVPTSSGVMYYKLSLIHRYQPKKIIDLSHIAPLGPDQANALAAWDCLQNFMDISQPLPDIPAWDYYRKNDPMTVKHDQQTGRDPDYWMGMSDEHFQQLCSDMRLQARQLDTIGRPDLMSYHVQGLPQSSNK